MDSPTCSTCVFWERFLPDSLSERESLVVKMRGEQYTLSEIAHVMQVSDARVRQILDKAKSKGVCRRFPATEHKRCDHWCGEHPDFPAYIAEGKARQ